MPRRVRACNTSRWWRVCLCKSPAWLAPRIKSRYDNDCDDAIIATSEAARGRGMWLQAQSLVGLAAIPALAWALAERRGVIAAPRLVRILGVGIGLQVLIA